MLWYNQIRLLHQLYVLSTSLVKCLLIEGSLQFKEKVGLAFENNPDFVGLLSFQSFRGVQRHLSFVYDCSKGVVWYGG